ncbi:hypothetical protein [Azospirillum sp. TSO5]|uniref:hypothetical protein n=1 Tax=Azospirillum sp. TSO5 TaxID=716760 RepID=UPI000D61BE3C|nr:hypothetical protein [Azospirillum sp. TSO5]PWC91942.1 hypothetical protein TSO5_18310 [Azospirillum sp. TSO5]
MTSQLLASAPSIRQIEESINKFWCSDKYRVDPETLEITHPDRKTPEGVRVIKKGKRYRFEMTSS